MKKVLRVGYLCFQNPENRRVWSGTHFSLLSAIRNEGHEVVNLSPIILPRSYHRLLTVYNKVHRIFSKKLIFEEFTLFLAFFANIYFKKAVRDKELDLVFSPAASASVALLKTNLPVVFFNDSTVDQLINYYHDKDTFSKFSRWESSLVQQLALQKASKIILPSDWATQFALDFYKVPTRKVKNARLGANMKVRENYSIKDFTGEIVFLFVGVVWERKGGDLVLDALEYLQKKGYRVKMVVAGGKPLRESPIIEYVGFLDKNNPDDEALLSRYYWNAHFLFVPSRAECYGIVYSEASAHGLITLATDTGGISSIIKNGENGFLLPLQATFLEYANLIEELLEDPAALQTISLNCRKVYDDRLHWKHFGKIFTECCNEIFPER